MWTEIHVGFEKLQHLILTFPTTRKKPSPLLIWRQKPEEVILKRSLVMTTLQKTDIDKKTIRKAINKYVSDCQTIGQLNAIENLLETIGPPGAVPTLYNVCAQFHKQLEAIAALTVVGDLKQISSLQPLWKSRTQLLYETMNTIIPTLSSYFIPETPRGRGYYPENPHYKISFRGFVDTITNLLVQICIDLGADITAIIVVGGIFALLIVGFKTFHQKSKQRNKTQELCRLEIADIAEFKAHLQALFSSLM